MHNRIAFVAVLGTVLSLGQVASAFTIAAGDLIVVDRGNGTLDDVNPTTGASTVIASGFTNPQGVVIGSDGTIYVSDIGTHTIDRVNPTTGIVTTYSGNGVGSGAALDRPFEMAFNSSGTLFVADGQVNSDSTNVISIAANGDRTVVAGNNGSSTNVFAQALAGLTIDPTTGNLYVSTASGHSIYQVTEGGSVSTIYSTTLGSPGAEPQGLAFASGTVYFANGGSADPAVYSVVSSGPPSQSPTKVTYAYTPLSTDDFFGLALGGPGTIYATSASTPDVIYKVDTTTGTATIISGNGVGGTTFGALSYGIAVYPNIPPPPSGVPEPSSLALAGIGLATGLGIWLRRR